MSLFSHIKLSEAYRLINHGPLVLISTVSDEWKYNIAPIAWNCPVGYNPVTKVLIGCDKESKTFQNILYSKEFTICVPSIHQVELVKKLGSCSGKDVDKMTLDFDHFPSIVHGNPVPSGILAYIDIKLCHIVDEDEVKLVIGEAIAAQVLSEIWDGSGLITNLAKTLHHIGDKKFVTISDILV